MGGEPQAALLSLALPRNLPLSWVDGFLEGLLELAAEFEVSLAGGDIAASLSGIQADIAVLGSVEKGRAVLRSGARSGDDIYVTGEVGTSAAALRSLFAGKKLKPSEFPRHFYPLPRIEVGRYLSQKGLASAMIDLSDGLSTDLGHICEESGVGAEIEAAAIPAAVVRKTGCEIDLNFALHGGDDYELLFTTPGGTKVPSRVAGVAITRIGRVTRGRKVLLRGKDGVKQELPAQGWEHFRKAKAD